MHMFIHDHLPNWTQTFTEGHLGILVSPFLDPERTLLEMTLLASTSFLSSKMLVDIVCRQRNVSRQAFLRLRNDITDLKLHPPLSSLEYLNHFLSVYFFSVL